jgi:hypothetical protein
MAKPAISRVGSGRPAGIIVVELAEARLEKAPVDHARERHQRVGQVDDLIEPRPEQIRLAALASLLRSHVQNHPHRLNGGRESRSHSSINSPENTSTAHSNPQTRILAEGQNPHPLRGFGVLHGRLMR